MVVPVFYLSPVGQGRSLGGPPRNSPKSGETADNGKSNFVPWKPSNRLWWENMFYKTERISNLDVLPMRLWILVVIILFSKRLILARFRALLGITRNPTKCHICLRKLHEDKLIFCFHPHVPTKVRQIIKICFCSYFIHSMQKPSVNLKLEAQINLIPQSSRENRTMDRLAAAESKNNSY